MVWHAASKGLVHHDRLRYLQYIEQADTGGVFVLELAQKAMRTEDIRRALHSVQASILESHDVDRRKPARTRYGCLQARPRPLQGPSGDGHQDRPDLRGADDPSQDLGDGQVLPDLRERIPSDTRIESIGGNGAYDTRPCHAQIAARDCAT